jgi:hypothetical protein
MKVISFLILLFVLNTASGQSPDIETIDNSVVAVIIKDKYGNYVGHGSGFVVDSLGTVVTNYHVVEQAFSLEVLFDLNGIKKTYKVEKIISGSKVKDLAKLKLVNANKEKFDYLKISKGLPSKGTDCWAIGTPSKLTYMNTVSKGIVSNIYTEIVTIIQTNADITHGSSGGALINNKGEIIGITSGGDSSTDGSRASINFAIAAIELSDMQEINKTTLVDITLSPTKVCFYSKKVKGSSIFLDGVLLGTIDEIFTTQPSCEENGTLTRTIYPGTHKYSIHHPHLNKWINGTITVGSNECLLFLIGEVEINLEDLMNRNSNMHKNSDLLVDKLTKNKNPDGTYTNLSTKYPDAITITFTTISEEGVQVYATGIGLCGVTTKAKPLVIYADKNLFYKFNVIEFAGKRKETSRSYCFSTQTNNTTINVDRSGY